MTTNITPQFRTIDGLSIRFAASDEKRPAQALLLCPWPESLYAYEATWSRLATQAQLTAIDLPGFGRSEYSKAMMSPRAMGEFIVRAADAFDLEKPHVVGPDIGTAAALFAAAAYPDRFSSITVGDGGAAVPIELGGRLKEWVFATDITPYYGIDGRQIVASAIGTLERYKPSEAAREDYLESYAGERFARSIGYVRAYPVELPILRDLLADIRTPVQIIAGRRDPLVPLVNAEYLRDRLPNCRLNILDAGHFIWEDAADDYAAVVTNWWAGGFKAVGAQRDKTSAAQ